MPDINEDKKIRLLLDLMDDDNDQTACLAMAELLKPGPENMTKLNNRLCDLQESSNPRLRRRVHQLESAIGARYRRHILGSGLKTGSIDLLSGLIFLHLCWFDNDRFENVIADWSTLVRNCAAASPNNMDSLAVFLMEQGFTAPANDALQAESYCFGCALDEKCGSDLLLSIVCDLLGRELQMPIRIMRDGLDFGVIDPEGNKLFPANNFQVIHAGKTERNQVTFLKDEQILRIVASLLFLNAVATDGFRYLYTIGSSLAAGFGENDLDFLPYPYNTNKKVRLTKPKAPDCR